MFLPAANWESPRSFRLLDFQTDPRTDRPPSPPQRDRSLSHPHPFSFTTNVINNDWRVPVSVPPPPPRPPLSTFVILVGRAEEDGRRKGGWQCGTYRTVEGDDVLLTKTRWEHTHTHTHTHTRALSLLARREREKSFSFRINFTAAWLYEGGGGGGNTQWKRRREGSHSILVNCSFFGSLVGGREKNSAVVRKMGQKCFLLSPTAAATHSHYKLQWFILI